MQAHYCLDSPVVLEVLPVCTWGLLTYAGAVERGGVLFLTFSRAGQG
jgi:hypothetical protein